MRNDGCLLDAVRAALVGEKLFFIITSTRTVFDKLHFHALEQV